MGGGRYAESVTYVEKTVFRLHSQGQIETFAGIRPCQLLSLDHKHDKK